jgi:hypothetical protein
MVFFVDDFCFFDDFFDDFFGFFGVFCGVGGRSEHNQREREGEEERAVECCTHGQQTRTATTDEKTHFCFEKRLHSRQ